MRGGVFSSMLTHKAYAKINLGLRILSRRDDGFHDLETVFHRIDLFDELTFENAETLSVESTPPILPSDERNLCYRAARLLQKRLGGEPGASITLTKKIPAGAGLGGGSSDAAASLLGLSRLWRANVRFEDLHAMALELGSDVSYFLQGGTAHATGRGEILDYFPLDVPNWILVLYPNVPVSTAWAYRRFSEKRSSRPPGPEQMRVGSLKEILLKEIAHPAQLDRDLQNDFEIIIDREYPPVAEARRLLRDSGASLVRLSGSGSALFGFYEGEEQAHAAVNAFEGRYFVSLTPPHFEPDLRPSER